MAVPENTKDSDVAIHCLSEIQCYIDPYKNESCHFGLKTEFRLMKFCVLEFRCGRHANHHFLAGL